MKKHSKRIRDSKEENVLGSLLTSKSGTGEAPFSEKYSAPSIELGTERSSSKLEREVEEDFNVASAKRLKRANTNNIQYDGGGHFPDHDDKPSKSRCKMDGCKEKTHVCCVRCKVHLCFVKNRNCFLKYHSKPR